MPDGPQSATLSVQRWNGNHLEAPTGDSFATEEPLEIRVRGHSIAVTMRTPGHDNELAAGFLAAEGLINKHDNIIEIAYCTEGEAARLKNILNVFLAPNVKVDLESLTRHVFASSSCGLCGKATIEAVQQYHQPVETNLSVCINIITSLPSKLQAAQTTFKRTGGLHAAAAFDRNGEIVVLREDIGRHNAVDKVIGFGILKNFSLAECILLVSGRTSFEIMQKALAARIPIVAAISAPSNLAVEFARENGQTLIGFLRGDTMNLYAHPERILTN